MTKVELQNKLNKVMERNVKLERLLKGFERWEKWISSTADDEGMVFHKEYTSAWTALREYLRGMELIDDPSND